MARTEKPDLEPEFTPTEDVEQDKRGILMTEYESYERIVAGLKLAADGARHLGRQKSPDLWNHLVGLFDQLRRAMVREAGFDRPEDAKETPMVFGGETLSWTDANSRVMDGLKMAQAGAEQIAQCQRMDLRWQVYASQIGTLRDKAADMALAASPLRVRANWAAGSPRMQ